MPCTLLCARLLELRQRRLECGLAALQFGRADEALVAQFLEALEVGRGLVVVHLRGGQRRLGGLLPEPQVLRVELGQQLAGLDVVAQVGVTPHDLAADAETEP